jgi:hypothetical protein
MALDRRISLVSQEKPLKPIGRSPDVSKTSGSVTSPTTDPRSLQSLAPVIGRPYFVTIHFGTDECTGSEPGPRSLQTPGSLEDNDFYQRNQCCCLARLFVFCWHARVIRVVLIFQAGLVGKSVFMGQVVVPAALKMQRIATNRKQNSF